MRGPLSFRGDSEAETSAFFKPFWWVEMVRIKARGVPSKFLLGALFARIRDLAVVVAILLRIPGMGVGRGLAEFVAEPSRLPSIMTAHSAFFVSVFCPLRLVEDSAVPARWRLRDDDIPKTSP